MSTIWYFNVVLNFSADLIRYATFWATSKAMQFKQMKSRPFYAEEKGLSYFVRCMKPLSDSHFKQKMQFKRFHFEKYVYGWNLCIKFSHGKWIQRKGMKMDVSSSSSRSRSSIENTNGFVLFEPMSSMNWIQLQIFIAINVRHFKWLSQKL